MLDAPRYESEVNQVIGVGTYFLPPFLGFFDQNDSKWDMTVVCGVKCVVIELLCPFLQCWDGTRQPQGGCCLAVRLDDCTESAQ